MEDELYKLEELSLVNKVTQEIFNFTSTHDKTLAEFVIALHQKTKKFDVFKKKLLEIGAPFPESFIQTLDRIILAMHPKYKAKKAKKLLKGGDVGGGDGGKGKLKEGADGKVYDAERDREARLFPGLALPDMTFKSIDQFRQDEASAGPIIPDVDDLMKELEGVASTRKRAGAADFMGPPGSGGDGADGGDERAFKRQRVGDGDSDDRGRNGFQNRDNGYASRNGGGDGNGNGYAPHQGAQGPGGRSFGGRPQIDEKPQLYKIYNGRVSNIKDFGAFITLEGVQGRVEGE